MTLNLKIGRRPWLPTADAVPGEELNHYDIPLAGFFNRGTREYLYTCLFGEVEEVNLWAYTQITPEDRWDLTHAREALEYEDAMTRALRGPNSVTLAVASKWKLALVLDLRGSVDAIVVA